MAAVKIMSVPASLMMSMYREDAAATAKAALAAGQYTESRLFYVQGISQDAAEEVFDLTNNPNRQDERVEAYGRGPSLSSGDIVEVYNPDFSVEQWLCKPCGWSAL